MNFKDGYYVWKKGDGPARLSPYFSTAEFECRCRNESCQEQRISVELVDRLTQLREKLHAPITITEGFRCAAHQKWLASRGYQTAKGVSQHELGNAADVKSLVQPETLGILARDLFNAIGTGPTFLHLDTRDDKMRRWVYSD